MASAAEVRARTGGREVRRIVYSEDEIAARVAAMADEIAAAYPEGEELLVLGTLKGSFIFVADLIRQIARPLHVDFVAAASYGAGTVSSGHVRLVYDPEAELAGRHVLLVEDIIDSGKTIERLIPLLRARGPRSLELCALLHKHVAPSLALEPRWVGFDAPAEFLVGYGLDHSENYRNLPFIASL
jgi:hypoxanthine phosphoribosyltransferase